MVEYLELVFEDNSEIAVNYTSIKSCKFLPFYPGIQAQLDIGDYIKGRNLQTIGFQFIKSNNYDIEIRLDDAFWKTARPLYKKRIAQRGTKIFLAKAKEKVLRMYYTSISQTVFDEDDETNECKDYPNIHFASYEDCDSEYIKNEYRSLYRHFNCSKDKNISTDEIVPLFSTRNLNEVSEELFADCDYLFGNSLMRGV